MHGMESVMAYRAERNLKLHVMRGNCRHYSGYYDRTITDRMVYCTYFDRRDAGA